MRTLPKVITTAVICLVALEFMLSYARHEGVEQNEESLAKKAGVERVKDGNMAVADLYAPRYEPEFLTRHFEEASDADVWSLNTIGTVNGTMLYFACDENFRTCMIIANDEILCEDPTLGYRVDTVGVPLMWSMKGTNDTLRIPRYYIYTSRAEVVLNKTDEDYVEKIKGLACNSMGFENFQKDYISENDINILYHIDIDYPGHEMRYENDISKWLAKQVDEDFHWNDDVPEANMENIEDIKGNHDGEKCRGDKEKMKSLCEFAANNYIEMTRKENAEMLNGISLFLNSCLSLKLVSSNGKYFSYQKFTYGYYGGAHGYNTEDIVTYVPKENEEITWDYLFVPGSEDIILELFYKTVQRDRKYSYWERTDDMEVIREHFEISHEGRISGRKALPQPGLTDEGIVFSFHPYEISCFAAGNFHFTLPYSEVLPYLTPKALKLCFSSPRH